VDRHARLRRDRLEQVHVLLAEPRRLALDVDHAVVRAVIDERRAHPRADALVVLVGVLAEQDAAPVAHDVLDDRAGDAQVAAVGVLLARRAGAAARPPLLDLDLELAALLVLDQHADVLRLREQIEQRVDELREQRVGGVARRGRVQDLGERVELALDQPDRALIGDADHPRADDRHPARARLLAAADDRARARRVDDRDRRAALGVALIRGVARLDPDPVVRDHDLVVVAEHGALLHLHAVDERAVVRAEVLERPAVAFLPQPRVLPRHAHVRDEDLAVGAPANDVLAVGQLVPTPGDRSGQEHQRGHV
jgi:hypothetical protein